MKSISQSFSYPCTGAHPFLSAKCLDQALPGSFQTHNWLNFRMTWFRNSKGLKIDVHWKSTWIQTLNFNTDFLKSVNVTKIKSFWGERKTKFRIDSRLLCKIRYQNFNNSLCCGFPLNVNSGLNFGTSFEFRRQITWKIENCNFIMSCLDGR